MSNELATKNNTGSTDIIDSISILTNGELFDRMMIVSKVMANSGVIVPAHFRGKPDACMAVVMQAARWGIDPFIVAQKTHIVGDALGYEAQLVNTVINRMAPTKDRLHYDWFGPWEKVIGKFVEKTSAKGSKYIAPGWSLADENGVGVKIWATLKGETEPRVLELLLSQAQVRNSTLWASDPRQQLAYLGIKRWTRLYCPDVLAGVYTSDELGENEARPEKDITPIAEPIAAVVTATSQAEPEPAGNTISAEELAAELGQALDEASTPDEAAKVEERIAAHKAQLGNPLLFTLKGKAQKKRSGFRAIREISDAFDAVAEPDELARQQLVTLIENRKNVLPAEEYQRFTIALQDIFA
ncbi:recombinase RecT [Pantoea agglomerans]|uniref:Recombinase RecT n=1 Tax=Enterobacter agglomerans TaxID=549 RepID=A0ACC5PXK6_ENTAG|nr:RecT family recombinase [Pantoea agglomerans]MBD8129055.1 recombinase RecT [Pantoea agglomerans]MBD8153778.1 recombinase RecT [Pantoea agglomerans]MBD8157775.1 recombinase RecT [Pantoea agglomerans]MBD8231613.1 recombinase RecT [Pantoea agglomerans]MBD8241693.1 recombinase RecT [Pantoea agglomerans]